MQVPTLPHETTPEPQMLGRPRRLTVGLALALIAALSAGCSSSTTNVTPLPPEPPPTEVEQPTEGMTPPCDVATFQALMSEKDTADGVTCSDDWALVETTFSEMSEGQTIYHFENGAWTEVTSGGGAMMPSDMEAVGVPSENAHELCPDCP